MTQLYLRSLADSVEICDPRGQKSLMLICVCFSTFFMTNSQEQRRKARNGMKTEHGVWFIYCYDLLIILFGTDIIYGACAL